MFRISGLYVVLLFLLHNVVFSSSELTSYEIAEYRECFPGEFDGPGVYNCDCGLYILTSGNEDEYVRFEEPGIHPDNCVRKGTKGNNCRFIDVQAGSKKRHCRRQDVARAFEYAVEEGSVDEFLSQMDERTRLLAEMLEINPNDVQVLDDTIIPASDSRRRRMQRRQLLAQQLPATYTPPASYTPLVDTELRTNIYRKHQKRAQRRNLMFGNNPACDCGFYPSGSIQYSCDAFSGSSSVTLSVTAETTIANIPADVIGLEITVTADVDLDLQLYDGELCIAGSRCANVGGQFEYEGMNIEYTGDDRTDSVTEVLTIDRTTRELVLGVKAYGNGDGVVSYSWTGMDPCPSTREGCSECSTYGGCKDNLVPICDGSAEVICVATEEQGIEQAKCDDYQPGDYFDMTYGVTVSSRGENVELTVVVVGDENPTLTGDPLYAFNGITNVNFTGTWETLNEGVQHFNDRESYLLQQVPSHLLGAKYYMGPIDSLGAIIQVESSGTIYVLMSEGKADDLEFLFLNDLRAHEREFTTVTMYTGSHPSYTTFYQWMFEVPTYEDDTIWTCEWVQNNYNTVGERNLGDVDSFSQCISFVHDRCPEATIANMPIQGMGDCWCQYGTDMRYDETESYTSCLLSTATSADATNSPTSSPTPTPTPIPSSAPRIITVFERMIVNRSTAEQADLKNKLDNDDFSNDWGTSLLEIGIISAGENATNVTIAFRGNVYQGDPCVSNPDLCPATECIPEDGGVCSNETVHATLCASNANCQRNFYCFLNGCLECPDVSECANLESGDYDSRLNCEACTQYTTEPPANPTVIQPAETVEPEWDEGSGHGDPIIWTFLGDCYDLSNDGTYLASSVPVYGHEVYISVYNDYMREVSVTEKATGRLLLSVNNLGEVIKDDWPFHFQQHIVPCQLDVCYLSFTEFVFDAQDFEYRVQIQTHDYLDPALREGEMGLHLDVYPRPFEAFLERKGDYSGLYFYNPLPGQLESCPA